MMQKFKQEAHENAVSEAEIFSCLDKKSSIS